jgi:cytochrome c553
MQSLKDIDKAMDSGMSDEELLKMVKARKAGKIKENEMKITKSKLNKIIKEEISKHVKENYRDAADDSMADTVPHS